MGDPRRRNENPFPKLRARGRKLEAWAAANPIKANLISLLIGGILSYFFGYLQGLWRNVDAILVQRLLDDRYALKGESEPKITKLQEQLTSSEAKQQRRSALLALDIIQAGDRDGARERSAVWVQVYEVEENNTATKNVREFVTQIRNEREPPLNVFPAKWRYVEVGSNTPDSKQLKPDRETVLVVGPAVSVRLACNLLGHISSGYPGKVLQVAVSEWEPFEIAVGYPLDVWKNTVKRPTTSKEGVERDLCKEFAGCPEAFSSALDIVQGEEDHAKRSDGLKGLCTQRSEAPAPSPNP